MIVFIWDVVVWLFKLPIALLAQFNMIYEWAAYFIFHYDEYLRSAYFNNDVWDELISTLFGWFLFGLYLFFWPITFPITLALLGAIIIYLLYILLFDY